MKKYVLFIIIFLIGYFIGRSTVSIPDPIKVTEIKWEKGESVTDTLYYPAPYEVIVNDTIPVYTDTTKLFEIWKDYYLTRKYKIDFSNDTIGTFKADINVSQNKLISATSFISPVVRTIREKEVIYKVPRIQGWAMLGSSLDLKTSKVQFGVDLKNKYLFSLSGIKLNDSYGYTLDFGIKF